MGELSSSNHITIACHCSGNPAGGPPSKGRPAPATPRLSCRQRHSGAGCRVGSPALGGGAGARPPTPTPTAPTLVSAHPGARTPAHQGARTAHRGHRRALSGCEWGRSRIPLQRRWDQPAPPRPSNSPVRAQLRGLQSLQREAIKGARRRGLGWAPRGSGQL